MSVNSVEAIDTVIDEVNSLIESGSIMNPGIVEPMSALLQQTADAISRGATDSAQHILDAFIVYVERQAEEDARSLIDPSYLYTG